VPVSLCRLGVSPYSVAPRRLVRLGLAGWIGPEALPLETPERERVPCPNPRLAKEETSLRMVSIGVEASSIFGFDNPNNSHRIFGLYDGRTLFLPCLPPLHPPEIFMCDSFCDATGSPEAFLSGLSRASVISFERTFPSGLQAESIGAHEGVV
jgi:hypothetical protein